MIAQLKMGVMTILAVAAASGARDDYWPHPLPESYLRAADQVRARMVGLPCRPEDIGHGCSRIGGLIARDGPCQVRVSQEPPVVSHLPTDQCYKMLPARHYRGVWIDAFEGSRFYPGLTAPPPEIRFNYRDPDIRRKIDEERKHSIWLDVERVHLSHGYEDGKTDSRAVLIEFIGRQTRYPGWYGHMGMSAGEIIVDRFISAVELK